MSGQPTRPTRSLAIVIAGAAAGIGVVAALAAHVHPAKIGAALAGGGLPLLLAVAYRVVPLGLNTMSWRALLPRDGRFGWPTLLRLRWIGESVNALLPVAQVGGDFARAHLLVAGGTSGTAATATLVVDVALGAIAQVVFTLLGVAALAACAPGGLPSGARIVSILIATTLTVAIALALLAVAHFGVARLISLLPRRGRSSRFATRLSAGAAGIDKALGRILRRHDDLARSATWHLAGWISQVGETWLILSLLGVPVSFGAALAIESLAASARGAAFAVPGGLGVQEGALVLLAAAFGVGMPHALALGIIKRGRELLVGAPAILAWSIAERRALGHLWNKRNVHNMQGMRSVQRAPAPAADADGPESWLRVGVLVDLHWTPTAGGHVKTWERLAAAAASSGEPLDLTVHFLGAMEATHVVGPHVRYRIHKPLLSSASLPFLSHIPDHTDLAPHNPRLAARLRGYDVIHTTDGTFAAARTAERVASRYGISLVNSVHTTTPFYTRVFTEATVERLVGTGRLAGMLLGRWNVAGQAEARMQRRLEAHQRECAFVLASRTDDRLRLAEQLGADRVGLLRRGIDHLLFDPRRRDRLWLEAELGIPRDRRVVISVGRLDRIKNVLVLAEAIRLLGARGAPVQLLCPGKGPDREALVALLGDRVTCPGVLAPETLARAYASADLCAQPAVIEELSNAVLEASSSGLPLLVGESSGSARFLIDGETGLVVRGSTVGEWAAALGALLDDPVRLERMSRAARAWSLEQVPTWHRVLLEDLLPIWRRASERLAGARGGAGARELEVDSDGAARNRT